MRWAAGALSLALMATAAAAAGPEGVPAGQHGAFAVMTDGANPPKVCFAVAAPQASEAKGVERKAAFLYVSTWAKDGIKSQISVRMGFSPHSGSEATLLIGDDSFKLFASGDRLYVADPVRELKLLDALKKGAKATVIATSDKGVRAADTYSLAGLGQALQAVAKACP